MALDQSTTGRITINNATMEWLITVLLLGSVIHCQSLSGDTLHPNQPLNDTTTIVSAKGTYVLGFFSPSNKTTRYLGIWYRDMKPLTIVWVANRQVPIPSSNQTSNGTLTLTTDGMLNIKDGATSIWSTGTIITAAPKAQLLDSGNFVVTDNKTGNLLWQSFDSPGDTMLPTMWFGFDTQAKTSRYLTAWKSSSDPALGDFLVKMDPKRLPDMLLYYGNTLAYRTGVWNGRYYDGIPETAQETQVVFNMSWTPTSVYYSYIPVNATQLWRFVLQDDGVTRQWYSSGNAWVEFWPFLFDNCDRYAFCGLNGVCLNANADCDCLPGYIPKAPDNWRQRNFSDGCVRSELFNCTKENDFITIQHVKRPDTFNTTTFFGKSFGECRSACLGDCFCVAFAYIDNKCVNWHGPLVDIRQFDSGDDFYLRSTVTEKSKLISSRAIISAIVSGVLFLSVIVFVSVYCLRRRSTNSTLGTQRSSFSVDHLVQPQETKLYVDLETFDITTLRAATNNFHDNKLGEGCFGPVYKATLEGGRVIATKRLAKEACKGLRQFVNEVNLLGNLSHRNLIQLIGYCIDDQERILCYEYMPNGSLDKFLEDHLSRTSKHDLQYSQLDWNTRYKIIEEVSCGILYLHDECGKKIVHRDLKPGNILLDENMIPKISDFGFAKLCRKDQRSTFTELFAGTRGYMAPEMVGGKISPKVDVFSFGIIIMEIITGRLAASFPTGIINHVVRYWMEHKELELIDPRMKENANKEEIIRFIMISLLCVQHDKDKRPEMRIINMMLNSISTVLHVPRDLSVDWGVSFEVPVARTSSSSIQSSSS